MEGFPDRRADRGFDSVEVAPVQRMRAKGIWGGVRDCEWQLNFMGQQKDRACTWQGNGKRQGIGGGVEIASGDGTDGGGKGEEVGL